jgi:isopropylmalate/homocitrate/citramalate synthase
VIEGPVSDTKLQTLGVSREEMLSRIRSVVEAAAGSGIKVAFFGVDGSRADPAFLRQAYETAVEAGAVEAVVVDTLGIASPEAVAELVGTVRAWLGKDVAIHFHGHNDFGVATACAVAAVRAGADWIHGTINGMGERAGNANLLEVALALEALFRVETNVDLRGARVVSELVREACDYRLEPWKPVTGENLFRRESAAIAAQFHQPEAIEPYSSSLVGLQREIVLGRKSGLASIRIACEELGVSLDADTQQRLLERVHEFSTRQRSVLSTDDLRDLIASLDGHG